MRFKIIVGTILKTIHLKIDKKTVIRVNMGASVIKSSKKGERLEMIFKTNLKTKTWI